jgi:hypothetical protein
MNSYIIKSLIKDIHHSSWISGIDIKDNHISSYKAFVPQFKLILYVIIWFLNAFMSAFTYTLIFSKRNQNTSFQH